MDISLFLQNPKALVLRLLQDEQFLLMLLLGLTIVIVWIVIRKRFKSITVFKTDVGTICVARKGLQNIIYAACENVGFFRRPSVKIKTKGKKFIIDVKIQLDSNQQLGVLAVKLQNQIQESIQNNLGLDHVGDINILVSDFDNKPSILKDQSAQMLQDQPFDPQEQDSKL